VLREYRSDTLPERGFAESHWHEWKSGALLDRSGKNARPRDEPSRDKAAPRNSRLVKSRNRTQFFGTAFWDRLQP